MKSIFIFCLLTGVSLGVEDGKAEPDLNPDSVHPDSSLFCTDYRGEIVQGGEQFKSRLDPCERCVCEGGHAVRCMAVRCAPPECDLFEIEEGECCIFICLTPGGGPHDGNNNTGLVPMDTIPEEMDNHSLGLRLVASTVTSFLILALLLFMVHRLRQRRILIMMRRMNEEHGHDDAVAYMSQFDQIDMGIEYPPYEDPPPPYTPPKPPSIPMGDAPPPYEAATGNNNIGEGGGVGGDNGPLLPNGGSRPLQGSGERTRPDLIPNHVDMRRSIQLTNANLIGDFGDSTTDEPDEAMFADIVDHGRRHFDSSGNGESEASSTSVNSAASPQAEQYGLSVAVATVASDVSPNSPSHVIVRLHSNGPQSQVVKKSGDVSTSSGQSKEDTNVSKKVNNPRTQFLKRSDSMEIKHSNSSPRNSYFNGEATGSGNQDTSANNLPENEPNPDQDGKSYCNPAFDSSAPRNKSLKTFRISEEIEQSSCCQGSPSSPETTEAGLQCVSYHSHSSEDSATEKDERGDEGTAQRPPGLDLDLISSTEASQEHTVSPSMISDHVLHAADGAVGLSPWQLTVNGQSQAVGGIRVGNSTPSTGNCTPQSPMSPVVPLMGRSGSIGSHVSQFSVCSETGEKKRPKHSLPVAISNDSQYPLSPLSSKYVAPPLPPVATPQNRPSTIMTSSQSGSSLAASNLGATHSPTGAHGSSQSSSSRSTLERESHPPRISYVDQNFNDVGVTESRTALEIDDNEVEKQKKPSRIKRSDSGNSRSGSREAKGEDQAQRNTVRKLKQKKRRSRGSIQSPADGAAFNGDVNDDGDVLNQSPDTNKKSTKARDSPGTTYKQYGFIDDPDVLASRDVDLDAEISPKLEGRRDSSKERKRRGSKDRKRDVSKERRDRSKERRRDGSKSRENSGERAKRDGSRERRRDRSSSRDRNKRLVSSREQGKRDSFKDRDRTVRDGYMGDVSEDSSRYNEPSWRRKKSAQDQDFIDENRKNGIEMISTKESRPLERDIVHGSASLERKRKRRSTGDHFIPDSQVVAAILANGHIDRLDNANQMNSLRNNKIGHQGVKSSKSRSSMSKDGRNSIPVISDKQPLPDR